MKDRIQEYKKLWVGLTHEEMSKLTKQCKGDDE